MKKFVKHILWFVLPVVILLVAAFIHKRRKGKEQDLSDLWNEK